MSLHKSKLAFIGGGNMASAIIGGLITQGMAALGVQATASNVEAGGQADIIIIAVKPQSLQDWLRTKNSPTAHTKDGRTAHTVRVMPNTPALLGQGASGVFASADVTAEEKTLVNDLLASVSQATEWVDREELLDVVTGLSGSGPPYFFAMVEHLVSSATALGLSSEQATRLAAQTCLGAGKMLVESSDTPTKLRQNVTSPNGTTHAALQTFEAEGFQEIVDKAVKAATNRAAELGNTLAGK
ncbi:pyrroline-5-carboxylate reductase [Aspergillus campestris IBT 28561]|uniref:Pyrroline-5-carboxylate reductase n=1 Tax=Aspergillus campestris (strain IBT 28561) TaxID=1392248 RepID=A0A2I1DCP0_ASPC2|nr:pyrroline-5-carboxylate reductase [Aspergillus campestris IBT 28561]PKY07649.1 pyrroline-5-carboxylate reductase [Aspergillus campestris IBT 28561]